MLTLNHVDRLDLGICGENAVRTITIDCFEWLEYWPNGTISIWHQRHGETGYEPTGATFDQRTGILTWTPSAYDTYYAGDGRAQICLTEGGTVRKYRMIKTLVHGALVDDQGDPVESSWQEYVDVIEGYKNAAQTAQTAAEDAQEAAETAQGKAEDAQDAAEDAQEAAEAAQDAAEDAQEAAETAQEKAELAQGAAEAAAAEGAAEGVAAAMAELIDDTSTAADKVWSAQKSNTRYEKPSGGIPLADLASAVRTEINKIATRAPISHPSFTGSISLGRSGNAPFSGNTIAVGTGAKASGNYSQSFGQNNKAEGVASHAIGTSNQATAENSAIEGYMNVANGANQHVSGRFNDPDDTVPNFPATNVHYYIGDLVKRNLLIYRCNTEHDSLGVFTASKWDQVTRSGENLYVEIVGNGSASNSKGNARTTDWLGNGEFAGDVKAGACGGEYPVSLKETASALVWKVNKADIADNLTTQDADKVLSAKQGYVLNAAKYEKPSGGIPASDIAEGVIPDPEDLIDDTAGDGDTDKVWSADKSAGEVSTLSSALNAKADEPTGTKSAGKVYGLNANLEPEWQTVSGGGTVDSSLSTTSENPVQNKVITNALNSKQDAPVTNDLSQWLFAQNKYIDSGYNLHDLDGYDTYRIPCNEFDFISISWVGSNPFGSLSANYYWAFEDSNGFRRDLGDENKYMSTGQKDFIFIAPANAVAFYFTFKSDLIENAVLRKNTSRNYLKGADYSEGFIVPVNKNTFVNDKHYINYSNGNLVEWSSDGYNVYWCRVKAGDQIKFNSNVTGLPHNATFKYTLGSAERITALSYTFAADGIVIVYEKADQANNAVYIPKGTKLAVEAGNVVGIGEAISEIMPDYSDEIEALGQDIENIESQLELKSVDHTTGAIPSAYCRLVSGSDTEIEIKYSSSFSYSKIEVQDWMYEVDFNVLSVSSIASSAIYCGFADANDLLISRNPIATGQYKLTVPSNAKYIYLNFFGATYCAKYTIKSDPYAKGSDIERLQEEIDNLDAGRSFDGLTGVAFGTSLTYRAQTTGGYLQYLPALSGITFDNQGVGSSSILGDGGNYDMLAKIKAYTGYSGKRVCLIEGFVNDWYNYHTLGTYTDTAETSVCGCVRSALNYILSQNANLTVFLILDPYGRNYSNVDCSSSAVNNSGLTQYAFYEEIAKVAESLGIPVIKEYAGSQISENTPQYLLDNIHPNALGAMQSANFIWSRMKQHYANEV